jgi:hypothetical protein
MPLSAEIAMPLNTEIGMAAEPKKKPASLRL